MGSTRQDVRDGEMDSVETEKKGHQAKPGSQVQYGEWN